MKTVNTKYDWEGYNAIIKSRLNVFINDMDNRYEKEWFKRNYDDVIQTCHMYLWEGILENKIKNINNPIELVDYAIKIYYNTNKQVNHKEMPTSEDADVKRFIIIKKIKDTYPMSNVMDIIDILGGI